ncbi:hypothetical protein ScalyP_jg7689 [Parmales sp. scaly parma]|nr:hypothetical protein ScalyP_jg7689 [Parmales sp. scaly parma]
MQLIILCATFALYAVHPLALAFDPRISPHEYSKPSSTESNIQKLGLLVVDHGSRAALSNQNLDNIVGTLRANPRITKTFQHVRHGHMEIASPSIIDGLDGLISDGCDKILVHPFFLGAEGRHAKIDVPAIIANYEKQMADSTVEIKLGRVFGSVQSTWEAGIVCTAVEDAGTELGVLEDGVSGAIGGFFREIQEQIAKEEKAL